ncbi:MAG: hypothetical protein K9J17_02760 [Flavobacteriales bacterium]|nr:hypothetical protein [Flavobacteriales bacterium]
MKSLMKLFIAVVLVGGMAGCGDAGKLKECQDSYIQQGAIKDSILNQIRLAVIDSMPEVESGEKAKSLEMADISKYNICLRIEKHTWPAFATAIFEVYDNSGTSKPVFEANIHQLAGVEIFTTRQKGKVYSGRISTVAARDPKRVTQQKDFDEYSDFKLSFTKDLFGHGESSPALIGATDGRNAGVTTKEVVLADLYTRSEGAVSSSFFIHFNDRSPSSGTLYLATSGTVNDLKIGKEKTDDLGVSHWTCKY